MARTTAEKIAVMQYFEKTGEIECRSKLVDWYTTHQPDWNWKECDYRIKRRPFIISNENELKLLQTALNSIFIEDVNTETMKTLKEKCKQSLLSYSS